MRENWLASELSHEEKNYFGMRKKDFVTESKGRNKNTRIEMC